MISCSQAIFLTPAHTGDSFTKSMIVAVLALLVLVWLLPVFLLWIIPRPALERIPQRPEGTLPVSIIIPARNEERTLPILLESLTHQGTGTGEVIVVNDHSEDVALGRLFDSAGLELHNYGGKGTISFRMYPSGIGSLITGFSKGMASGAQVVDPKILIPIIFWVAGGFEASFWLLIQLLASDFQAAVPWTVLHVLYILQIYWILYRMGNYGMVAAAVLSERRLKVTLYEGNDYLGGKIGCWPVCFKDGFDTRVEHGFHTGVYTQRPAFDPGINNLCPAGDWVKLPYPAMLMEAATTSALLSANAILIKKGLRPDAVFSVPLKGLFARR